VDALEVVRKFGGTASPKLSGNDFFDDSA